MWKVCGKLFAVGGWGQHEDAFTFKVDASSFAALRDMPGLRPAPYFASRGMTWIQHYASPGLDDDELMEHLEDSYELAVVRLPKRIQAQIRTSPGRT